jgi:nucleoside 2-deoxyribosyltransferase
MSPGRRIMKPKVYIAAPCFNRLLFPVLSTIEVALTEHNVPFFSPRLELTKHLPSKKDLRQNNPEAWKAVYNANLIGMRDCDWCLAVLHYPLAKNQRLSIMTHEAGTLDKDDKFHVLGINTPDMDTFLSMGWMSAFGKPVIGFRYDQPIEDLSVMASETCDGMITGFSDLDTFLRGSNLVQDTIDQYGLKGAWRYETTAPDAILDRVSSRGRGLNCLIQFNLSVCELWQPRQEIS